MKGRKKITVLILFLIVLLCIVFAENNSNQFKSTLPDYYSTNVTYEEIKSDLANYIRYKHKFIEFGSRRYIDFLSELSTSSSYNDDLSEVTLRYYRTYASYYLSNVGLGKVIDLSGTIG